LAQPPTQIINYSLQSRGDVGATILGFRSSYDYYFLGYVYTNEIIGKTTNIRNKDVLEMFNDYLCKQIYTNVIQPMLPSLIDQKISNFLIN
jgi:hypothetical protein